MSMTIAEIRTALQDQLLTIPGMQAFAQWPSSFETPACLVRPVSLGAQRSMGDPDDRIRTFEVLLAAIRGDLEAAQDTLDTYLDPTGALSVVAALEATPGVQWINATWSGYGGFTVHAQEPWYLGALIAVEVLP